MILRLLHVMWEKEVSLQVISVINGNGNFAVEKKEIDLN